MLQIDIVNRRKLIRSDVLVQFKTFYVDEITVYRYLISRAHEIRMHRVYDGCRAFFCHMPIQWDRALILNRIDFRLFQKPNKTASSGIRLVQNLFEKQMNGLSN